jgi:hypothetical protein
VNGDPFAGGSGPPQPDPDVSVIVAVLDAARVARRSLAAIEAECAGHSAELIAVAPSDDGTAAMVAREFPAMVLLTAHAGALTPVLWALGASRARGTLVVFTTAHCVPRPGWLAGFSGEMARGRRGAVGGPLVLADQTSLLDWAVFYLRYSAFTPETIGPDGVTELEIAGDNGAYAGDVLERHAAMLGEGFWELDVHRVIRAENMFVAVSRAAVVEFGPSFSFSTIVRHRFAHGRHFGASRVRAGTRRRWQVLAAAPLVPALLALRVARRVLPLPNHRWRFLAGLPLFVALACAWSAGEAVGAWQLRTFTPAVRRPW